MSEPPGALKVGASVLGLLAVCAVGGYWLVKTLGPDKVFRWAQTWPLYVVVISGWTTLLVRSMDLNKCEALSEYDQAAFRGRVQRLRARVWIYSGIPVITWILATLAPDITSTVGHARTGAHLVGTLFILSLVTMALWPPLWHRIEAARTYLAMREQAEKARAALVESINKSLEKPFEEVQHYKGYDEPLRPASGQQ